MTSRRYSLIGACILAAALAVSCGPSGSDKKKDAETADKAEPAKPTAAATTAPIDPCELLTKAEAEKILGAPAKDGRTTHDVGFAPGTKCTYFTAAPIEIAGGVWSVSVEVFDQARFEKEGSYFKSPAEAYHRSYKAAKSVPSNAIKDVPGLGESAYWNGQQLSVLDKGVEVAIAVRANFHIPPGSRDEVEAAEDAARLRAATDLAKTIVLPRLEAM